jgi:cytochrome c-type biogenesis protein CcmF
MPWLTCTVFIHSLMVWRHRDGGKRTALALAIATFGLCNFATFLTRSGIFSSLHAFSQSPIGWMFLVLMILLLVVGAALIWWRRRMVVSTMRLCSLWARETQIAIAGIALLLLTAVIFVGTVLVPVSTHFAGAEAVVGPPFYNAVLVPTGLLLLSTTVAVPLLQWGAGPNASQRRLLWVSLFVGAIAVLVGLAHGVRRPEALIVILLAGTAPVALIAGLALELRRNAGTAVLARLTSALQNNRRSFAGSRQNCPTSLLLRRSWKLSMETKRMCCGPPGTFMCCKNNGRRKWTSARHGAETFTAFSTTAKVAKRYP